MGCFWKSRHCLEYPQSAPGALVAGQTQRRHACWNLRLIGLRQVSKKTLYSYDAFKTKDNSYVIPQFIDIILTHWSALVWYTLPLNFPLGNFKFKSESASKKVTLGKWALCIVIVWFNIHSNYLTKLKTAECLFLTYLLCKRSRCLFVCLSEWSGNFFPDLQDTNNHTGGEKSHVNYFSDEKNLY